MIPHKGRAILLALASVITTLAELMAPLITERLVDDVLVPEGAAAMARTEERLVILGWFVLALVGVRVVSWAAEFVHGWTVTWLAARVTADIRAHLYRRLEMLSLQFYDKRQTGALISRVTRDAGMLEEFLIDGVPYLVINGLMIIWSGVFWRRMRRIFYKYGRGWSGLGSRLNEALNGIRVVKAFAQEERELNAFERKNVILSDISRKTARNFWTLWATMSLFSGFAMIIVWFAGGLEVLDGTLKIGTLLAMYSYMWMVYGPLEWLTEVNVWMTRAFAGAERIFEIIDTDPEPYADPHAVAMPKIAGRVTFRDVTFGYDKSKPVLHEVNLEVEPGEMIGLVGKSGVGKTTTVNLISRFYDVDQGQILIDGVDIGDVRLQDLRRQIGIVQQSPVLFSGSIADNISYGKLDAAFEDVVAAAKAANAHQFICAKGDGYDTKVSERGDNLSGGEKQRIAIA
jgi:ATP-binding cassette subfamily B protein